MGLLRRYDELVATSLADPRRLSRLLGPQQRLILALDGLQPHKGHEVLWVVRETLSGQVLLARSLLSARVEDLAELLQEVKGAIEQLSPKVPQVVGLLSDGQQTIRTALAQVFPGVPHQLCQFHYLREAARPAFEADRAAKKELKKQVRGVREIERGVEAEASDKGAVVRGYCAAVRAALDDEGQPPLDAPGLKLRGRLQQIGQSLAEAGKKRGALPRELTRLQALLGRAMERTAARWPDIQAAYEHIWGVAQILKNEPGLSGAAVREQLRAALEAMAPRAGQSDWLKAALAEFVKVTASHWPGLFHCYDVKGLGRTNNELEQFFGSWRWHERRATGRKGASRAEVLVGPASLASSLASRLEVFDGGALAAVDLERWRQLRAHLEVRQASHRQRWAFRHDPDRYLAGLQERAAKLVLPS